MRSCVLAIWVALSIGIADAQDQQQRYVPGPATQYDEADELALREYVDVRIDALDRSVQTALTSAKEAVLKAETATERRFENSNEWRDTVEALQRTYMPRVEFDATAKATSDRLDRLTEEVNNITSRSQGVSAVWPLLFGGFGVVVGIFGIYMGISNRQREPILAARK